MGNINLWLQEVNGAKDDLQEGDTAKHKEKKHKKEKKEKKEKKGRKEKKERKHKEKKEQAESDEEEADRKALEEELRAQALESRAKS